MGTPLGPKYILYTYMEPLGTSAGNGSLFCVEQAGCVGSSAIETLSFWCNVDK